MATEVLDVGYVIKYYPKRGGSFQISHIFSDRKSALEALDDHRDYYLCKMTGKGAKKPKVVKWIYHKIIYTKEEEEELKIQTRKNQELVNKMFERALAFDLKLTKRL